MKSFSVTPVKLVITHANGSYDVLIGTHLLSRLPDLLPDTVRTGRTLIVSDKRVASIYFEIVASQMKRAGITVLPPFIFSPGEKSKSVSTLNRLVNHLALSGMTRSDTIVALGGGVTGDLAGFAAAIYMRGIPYISIPTTLLAQADSSVGGKTGVNLPAGKNLVGAFHPPALVLSDLNTLDSLPQRHFRNGLAEIIKMAVICDPVLFDCLEMHAEPISMRRQRQILAQALITACRLKAGIVEMDEKERGIRIKLNFGHTFAHGIECVAGYGTILHGEAVALGMLASARLAVDLLVCCQTLVDRLENLLERVGLPIRLPPIDTAAVADAIERDKKSRSGTLRVVLPERIGQVTIKENISRDLLIRSLSH